jgi:hypothetical protein
MKILKSVENARRLHTDEENAGDDVRSLMPSHQSTRFQKDLSLVTPAATFLRAIFYLRNPRNLRIKAAAFVRQFLMLACLLFAGFGISVQAQNTLNVTNYGAVGDAVQFFANTVSNSVVVTTTNPVPDSAIGEAIEVFGAGAVSIAPNCQDMVATITNVVNGTNIYVSQVPQATLNNTFATYGYNNTTAFQNAIAAVGADTNDTIYIPAGTYLLLPAYRNSLITCSIFLQRGGINFVGAGTNATTLLSQGAWTLVDGSVFRGDLVGLFSNSLTDNFPLSFSYLTMDGGVQQGNTSQHDFAASLNDGTGWDITHDAYVVVGGLKVCLNYTYFTNVLVQHWRGEEFKSGDGSTNGIIGIYNSTFADGNATALNIYPAWDVRSNLFVNLFQVAEYYQQYSSYPSYFEYNVITNITGNGFAINGGRGNNPPFIIQSNVFYFSANNKNGIETTPGDNVFIISNQFICANLINTIVLGAAGYQGTFDNSNIVVAANDFENAPIMILLEGGNASDQNRVESLQVYGNTANSGGGGGVAALICYGWQTNVLFSSNDFSGVTYGTFFYSGSYGSQYVLVNTNNNYWSRFRDIDGLTTNYISYVGGSRYQLYAAAVPGHFYALTDTDASQIPAGAQIMINNTTYGSGSSAMPVYLNSSITGSPVILTNGQTGVFYWHPATKTWSTSNKPLPPSNLGGVVLR